MLILNVSVTISYVQTDVTTPYIVGQTMLGVVVSVVCIRIHQWPAKTSVSPAAKSEEKRMFSHANATTPNSVGPSRVLVYQAKLLRCCLQGDQL